MSRGADVTEPSGRFTGLIAAATYLLIVVAMWAPHTMYSGFPSETAFAYWSETSSVLEGFHFSDPMRVHTNVFYQLSYLLGEVAGVGGSYVPYQIVHASLWWLRGVLVFLLIRRLLPHRTAIAYVAGALVLVHASDAALQFAGQINQFGFIVWMLAACLAAVCAVDDDLPVRAGLLAAVACACAYMSLWSYESQLPLMLAFPALLLLRRWHRRWRALGVALCWYAVTAVYIGLTIARYATAGGNTYQAGVMRHDWRVLSLASDWWFNIATSVSFWHWVRTWPIQSVDLKYAALATAAFTVGAVALFLTRAIPEDEASAPPWTTLAALCGVGVLLLALSFPVYLLLASARDAWRTQLLSGTGAALTLAGAFAVAARASGRRLGRWMLVGLGAVVVWCGSAAALQLGASHRDGWEHHREVIAAILSAVPSVKPNSLVVVTGVRKDADPFGDNMWLDVSLRLAYSGVPMSAFYILDDGSRAPGSGFLFDHDVWLWDGTGFPPVVQMIDLARTVVVHLDAAGKGTLVSTFPPELCRTGCAAQLYDPASVIDGPVSPRAARRFRLQAAR